MSGSSGGGGGGGGRREISCEDLSFTTQLVTPQAAVATLAIGQVLQLDIVRRGAEQVLAALANGAVVGVLIGDNATRLRECILAGHSYTATVTRTNGLQITVDVEHA